MSIFQALLDIERSAGSAVLCTVIRSSGSTPRHTGSKMIVYPDRRTLGSVGGGELENRVISESMRALLEGKAINLVFSMSDPALGDPGICGGQVEVFLEPILPPPFLLIIGSGHVGKAVAHLARWLDFRVGISDDRPEYCTREAVPDADTFFPFPLDELTRHVQITPQMYLVLTTRGLEIDVPGLPSLLNSPAAYIGVIGSRRRWAMTVEELKKKGISEEKLARVHSPIGLGIGAETPEEIAVSILAEILMLRRGGSGKPMKYPK